MAAAQSTRASGAGSRRRKPGRAQAPDRPTAADLPAIVNELDEATCLLEVTCLALDALEDGFRNTVKPHAVTLRQGIALLNKARNRVDLVMGSLRTPSPRRGPP